NRFSPRNHLRFSLRSGPHGGGAYTPKLFMILAATVIGFNPQKVYPYIFVGFPLTGVIQK
ncbi:MAG: hypothetical protein ACE5I8_08495, partial [Thermodesulfobacteriota bacterium]